jgi:hypothetical protein
LSVFSISICHHHLGITNRNRQVVILIIITTTTTTRSPSWPVYLLALPGSPLLPTQVNNTSETTAHSPPPPHTSMLTPSTPLFLLERTLPERALLNATLLKKTLPPSPPASNEEEDEEEEELAALVQAASGVKLSVSSREASSRIKVNNVEYAHVVSRG